MTGIELRHWLNHQGAQDYKLEFAVTAPDEKRIIELVHDRSIVDHDTKTVVLMLKAK